MHVKMSDEEEMSAEEVRERIRWRTAKEVVHGGLDEARASLLAEELGHNESITSVRLGGNAASRAA